MTRQAVPPPKGATKPPPPPAPPRRKGELDTCSTVRVPCARYDLELRITTLEARNREQVSEHEDIVLRRDEWRGKADYYKGETERLRASLAKAESQVREASRRDAEHRKALGMEPRVVG